MSHVAAESPMALQSHLRPGPGETLYAVIDGAQDLELVGIAAESQKPPMCSLFEGNAASQMAQVAPYLVAIDPASSFLDEWRARSGRHVGVMLRTLANFEQLHEHLRHIFVAQDETGQDFFLRFYDPRVLRRFLPTCDAPMAADFFGPVVCFFAEAEDPQTLLRFTLGKEGAQCDLFPLPPESPDSD